MDVAMPEMVVAGCDVTSSRQWASASRDDYNLSSIVATILDSLRVRIGWLIKPKALTLTSRLHC